MNLTEHFTLEELTSSSIALRLGIDNSATQVIAVNLEILARGLEEVRELLGVPMHINSGYRCLKLNSHIGGASNSAHMSGFAADFVAPEWGDPEHIITAIAKSGIVFDQLINEQNWVHISFAPTLRQEVLIAHFGPNGTTYSKEV